MIPVSLILKFLIWSGSKATRALSAITAEETTLISSPSDMSVLPEFCKSSICFFSSMSSPRFAFSVLNASVPGSNAASSSASTPISACKVFLSASSLTSLSSPQMLAISDSIRAKSAVTIARTSSGVLSAKQLNSERSFCTSARYLSINIDFAPSLTKR